MPGPLQKHHRIRRNPLLPTAETETIGGSSFDINPATVNLQVAGDILFHLRQMGRQPGLLRNDDAVEIDHFPVFIGEHLSYPAQQGSAVRAPVLLVRGRKVAANIPLPGGADTGVADRVQQNIRIGMPFQAEGASRWLRRR